MVFFITCHEFILKLKQKSDFLSLGYNLWKCYIMQQTTSVTQRLQDFPANTTLHLRNSGSCDSAMCQLCAVSADRSWAMCPKNYPLLWQVCNIHVQACVLHIVQTLTWPSEPCPGWFTLLNPSASISLNSREVIWLCFNCERFLLSHTKCRDSSREPCYLEAAGLSSCVKKGILHQKSAKLFSAAMTPAEG